VSPAAAIRNQWLSTSEIAAEYGRTERQVRNWCADGTLRDFGFLVIRTDTSWWIHNPNVSRKP